MADEMTRWEREAGITFLRRVGFARGQEVLDFGARVGHYTLPLARVVGPSGRVVALDQDEADLETLRAKAEAMGLTNIEYVVTGGDLTLPLADASVDGVLTYDVLHYLPPEDRRALYGEVRRVLRASGLYSVYPKHVEEDWPMMAFRDVSLRAVREEIERAGFVFVEKACGTLSHDDWLNEGCVWNYRSRAR